jgi:hypothetical protein
MRFRHASRPLVLFTLMTTPCHAATSRVTLAPGASRTCAGETRVRVLRFQGQPVSNVPEQAVAMSETLSVRLTGDRYEVRRSNSMPGGETLLIAHIRPDGTVIDANMSGSLPMMGGGDRLRQMSMLASRMLSERLLMGRDFRPGDDLYASVDMRDLIAGMMGAMAAPPGFQMQGVGSLPFTGVTGDGTNRSLNFAGQIRATGQGLVNGQRMSLDFPGQATIIMDATTGLMRSTTTEGIMAVELDGVTQTQMHMRQHLTCTIASVR